MVTSTRHTRAVIISSIKGILFCEFDIVVAKGLGSTLGFKSWRSSSRRDGRRYRMGSDKVEIAGLCE